SGRRRNGFHPRTARRVRFDGRLLEQARRVDRGQLLGHTTTLGRMHERWRHATLIARGLVLSYYGSIDEHLFSGGIRRPEPAGVRFALPRRGAVGGKGDGERLVAAYHVRRATAAAALQPALARRPRARGDAPAQGGTPRSTQCRKRGRPSGRPVSGSTPGRTTRNSLPTPGSLRAVTSPPRSRTHRPTR